MLEMLKSRKEQLQAQGKKGFTLMEMLIVIAIIAILIAIAIPIFTTQLNNAKQSADEANARSIYAIAMADYMDNNTYDDVAAVNFPTNGDITVGGQSFHFSDLTTAGGVDISGTDGPVVTLTSNGTSYTFPGNTSGTSTTTP